MNKEVKLDTVFVGDIEGKFFVPTYQRGYRWGKDEVERLLEDINDNGPKDTYYLQPIVVKYRENHDDFELIDGQQRLTTLYLIYHYIHIKSRFTKDEAKFTLEYDTKPALTKYLVQIVPEIKDDNIDFFFVYGAYETIENWFNKNKCSLDEFYEYLAKYTKIIWYRIDDGDADTTDVFTRLNIGKIPLTNAELVKALFLNRGNTEIDEKRQNEIALQWDTMERELQDEDFWYFLTSDGAKNYQTHIDLILDLMAGIEGTDNYTKERYETFFYFDEQRKKGEQLSTLWDKIDETFSILKSWFESHFYYHKIGYLIATQSNTLLEVYTMYRESKNKTDFMDKIHQAIVTSIDINKNRKEKRNYADLNYESAGDKEHLLRLLSLFNVETVYQNRDKSMWFSFRMFKHRENGHQIWSLEHIHAQQSKTLNSEPEQRRWLMDHLPYIRQVENSEDLVNKVERELNKNKVSSIEFELLQMEIIDALSEGKSGDYMHSLSNLAILNTSDNAALNNSTFAVKRQKIIEMDQNGSYIPFCTRNVFLKYYSKSENPSLLFWGKDDRNDYISEINRVLKPYLKEEIDIEVGDKL